MNNIETEYNNLVNTPSDINEHLPVLKEYTSLCDHVTEMGVRWVISTYAFAAGKPKKLVCVDMEHPSHWRQGIGRLEAIETYCSENNIIFEFVQGNSLEIFIEPTDLLFIDTLHSYNQLKSELNLHSKNVKKYIILHDTESCAHRDETNYFNLITEDLHKKGLQPALDEFLENNKDWELEKQFKNNCGLTILKRIIV
jgi:hypothetical protein